MNSQYETALANDIEFFYYLMHGDLQCVLSTHPDEAEIHKKNEKKSRKKNKNNK